MRDSHVLRALVVYAGAAWAVLEATGFFVDKFGLPGWFLTVALVLLGAGLVSMVTTAVVQSQQAAEKRDVAGPTPWEVDLVDLKESVSRGRVPTLTWGRWALGGAVVFSLLFGFAGLYVLVTQRTPPPLVGQADAGPAIAVLPFRVVGTDAELWREGMVDLFYSNLDGVAGLRAIDPSVVVSRWRAAVGEAADAGAADQALAVARGIGASYALLGSMVGSANAVRLTAEVHDLRTGATQRAQVEGMPDRVMSLVDELCMELLRGGLAGELEGIPQLELSRITTASLPALVAHLEGEQLYRRSRFRESIPYYQAAVEEDSTFALALYRISKAYGWVDPFSEASAEYSRRANRFTDRLPARERQLLRSDLALERSRLEGVELLEELSARYPDDPEIWRNLGEAYYHVGDRALYPRELARDAFQRAVELDPDFGPAYIHLVDDAVLRSDTAGMRALIARHREIDSNSPHAHGMALFEAMALGTDSAEAAAQAAVDTASADALFNVWARFAWSGSLYPQEWLDISRALLQPRLPVNERQLGAIGVVFVYSFWGQHERARSELVAATRVSADPGFRRTLVWYDLLMYLTAGTGLESAGASAAVLAEDLTPNTRFWLGTFAATGERWAEAEAHIEALAVADSVDESGSAFQAAKRRALADALRGYVALRRGDYPRARRLLEESLRGLSADANGFTRYELGKLALELDDPAAAKRYFDSLALRTQALIGMLAQVEYYLGVTHEALGKPDEAVTHYGRFVNWWENADPELQPWVERGRAALERLTAEAS